MPLGGPSHSSGMIMKRGSNESDLVPVGQAAREVGVSPDTIRTLAKQRRLKVVFTPGRHRRVSLAEVKQLFPARTRNAKPSVPAEPNATHARRPAPSQAPQFVDVSRDPYWQRRAREARARAQVVAANNEARNMIEARRERSAQADPEFPRHLQLQLRAARRAFRNRARNGRGGNDRTGRFGRR